MTVIGRGWDRLTLPGKIVFTVVPVLIALTVGLVAAIVLLGQPILDILLANLPIVRFVVAVTIGSDEWARAVGKSKKEAEQMAAAEAHFRLEGSNVGLRPKR